MKKLISNKPLDCLTHDECHDLSDKSRHLISYLESLQCEIKGKYLNDILPNRIQSLHKELEDCETIVTLSGELKIPFWNENHVFDEDMAQARHKEFDIEFERALPETPDVGVAIKGFDIHNGVVGVAVTVVSATNCGVKIKVSVLSHVRIYLIEISYIATISKRSGIHIQNHMIDYTSDKELEGALSGCGNKQEERTKYIRKVQLPCGMEKPVVIAMLAGISVGSSLNPHFSVEVTEVRESDYTLAYSVWGDTTLYSVMATVIVYDRSLKSIKLEQHSSKEGKLYEREGPRKEISTTRLSPNIKEPVLFYGLYMLNLSSEKKYRLTQYYDIKEGSLSLTFSTWGDSKIAEVGDQVLIVCHTNKC